VGVGAPCYCTRRGARCTVRSSRSVSRECGVVIGEAATCEARGESFALPCEVWADAAERQEAARSESDPENHVRGVVRARAARLALVSHQGR
jgi:hypothetical protein